MSWLWKRTCCRFGLVFNVLFLLFANHDFTCKWKTKSPIAVAPLESATTTHTHTHFLVSDFWDRTERYGTGTELPSDSRLTWTTFGHRTSVLQCATSNVETTLVTKCSNQLISFSPNITIQISAERYLSNSNSALVRHFLLLQVIRVWVLQVLQVPLVH